MEFHTCLHITCSLEYVEILIAELSEAGFDMFQETEQGVDAFVEADNFDRELVDEIVSRYSEQTTIITNWSQIERVNWNEEWEKNFDPIFVDNKIHVRAHFHAAQPQFPYEIIITPKMSFGTGHHETTFMMLKSQLQIDHQGKKVLDAGCGTAILAIMASKLGAEKVDAFDIDSWCIENGKENAEMNNCSINIVEGTMESIRFDSKFDIILANITKNVLMDNMGRFLDALLPGGKLLLSGFHEADIDDLLIQAGVPELFRDTRGKWACLGVQKPYK